MHFVVFSTVYIFYKCEVKHALQNKILLFIPKSKYLSDRNMYFIKNFELLLISV